MYICTGTLTHFPQSVIWIGYNQMVMTCDLWSLARLTLARDYSVFSENPSYPFSSPANSPVAMTTEPINISNAL